MVKVCSARKVGFWALAFSVKVGCLVRAFLARRVRVVEEVKVSLALKMNPRTPVSSAQVSLVGKGSLALASSAIKAFLERKGCLARGCLEKEGL